MLEAKRATETAIALLQHYGFDLGDRTSSSLLRDWNRFDPNWIRLAIVECVYQGRYKAVSVEQILRFWERRGEPSLRFNHEFERLICGDFALPLMVQHQRVTRKPVPASDSEEKSAAKTQSPAYQEAARQMQLLAESSLFVDKLISICHDGERAAPSLDTSGDRDLVELPEPHFP